MTPRNHRRAIVAFFVYVAGLLSLPAPMTPAHAEDIDIFLNNPAISSLRPNVLIILDTSSNWASTDSVYRTETGITQEKFVNVRQALADTLEGFVETKCIDHDGDGTPPGTSGTPCVNTTIPHPGLDDRFNLGIMMYAETGGGNDSIDGGVIRKGVRQLTATNKAAYIDFFRNVDGNFDKSNNTSMGLAFHEAFLYFTGRTGFSGIGKLKRDYVLNTMPAPCSGPQNSNSNCSLAKSNALWALPLEATENPPPRAALNNSGSVIYNMPMSDACQKNFIIYIANGPITDPNSNNSLATSKLAALGGDTTQINFDTDDGNEGNITDEWARFLFNRPDSTDSTVVGNQKIVTYTVEVNAEADTQGRANTRLLRSMADNGGGRYIGVTTAGGGVSLATALNEVFTEIASVNSVFAAATLPVSVNVRGSFLNQVYMGVFRPDANASPRWPGNLKQYKLGLNASGGVILVDKNNNAIENPATGFVRAASTSFWSTATTFWDTTYYPNVKTDLVAATNSDAPDGEFVEKGGAAQRLRTIHATDVTTRTLYTCLSAVCPNDTLLDSSADHAFVATNANITDTLLGLSSPQPVTSLTRSGGTATASVTAHGFTTGGVIKIEGANQAQYNGNFNITVVDANTFTFTVTESPVTPATTTTTMQAAKGTGPVGVTSLTRSGTTVTATAPGHTFTNTQTITVTGANETTYNGSFVISGVVAGVSFQYTVVETPVSPATSAPTGTAAVGANSKSIKINNPGAVPAVTRIGTTVTVETQNNHGFAAGNTVVIAGVTPTEYNGSFTIASVPTTKTFTYNLAATAIGPATPATGTIVADAGTTRTISSLTRSGTTVTADTSPTNHGFSTSDNITISGATQPEYNGTFSITVTGLTRFTYGPITVSPATPATGTITATGAGGVTKASLVNWVRGANVQLDDNPNVTPTASATRVRAYLHGDVLHSRPVVVNYNRAGQPADRDLLVYYGANDGIIHAVKGGQNDADGIEKWGFIPSEFYDRFVRLYLESPSITTVQRKSFADGPVSVDTVYNIDNSVSPPAERLENGSLGTDARAQIYVGMRRGGRFYYSLDVTNPDAAPRYKWKIDNSGDFPELGQSWSEAKVVKLRLATCPGGADSLGICKVLVFGAGYDPTANDSAVQGVATMGRGVYVVDAKTGAHIWSISPDAFSPSTGTHRSEAGMTFAIAADLSVINTDLDVQNLADRIYAADTGGNIWRINISNADPATWTWGKLASLSGAAAADKRKFLFPPDVVAYNSTTDSVLIGSGDREHPFDTSINNRFYMIKDSHGINDVPAVTAITETDLVDLTSNTLQDPTATQAQIDDINGDLAAMKGWFIRLATGEKVVTGVTTLGGTTIFATNTPTTVSTPGSCTGPLGTALIYAIGFKDATATIDVNGDGVFNLADRAEERVGGGLPPTPIPFATQIGNNYYEGAITGTQVVQPPTSPVGQRYRVFWNLSVDN